MFLFLLFSCCVRLFVSPWTTAYQASLSHCLPECAQINVHLSQWCYLTISSSATLSSSCSQSFPASGSFLMSHLFASGGQSLRTSTLASILPVNIQSWFPLDWLVWSPCCPGDSQKSSLAPQFKSINSSVLNLLYGSTLASIHAYKKNHSFV